MDQWMQDLIADLRAGRVAAVTGSRAAVDLSLSETLLNRAIAAGIPPDGPVRKVQVRIGASEAFVTLRLDRPRFLPPITATLTLDRQPELPASPRLVLRLGLPAGLGMFAGFGAKLFATLPPGVRLDGDRLTVDLAQLLDAQDLGWVLRYAREALVTFEPGRVRIQGSAAAE